MLPPHAASLGMIGRLKTTKEKRKTEKGGCKEKYEKKLGITSFSSSLSFSSFVSNPPLKAFRAHKKLDRRYFFLILICTMLWFFYIGGMSQYFWLCINFTFFPNITLLLNIIYYVFCAYACIYTSLLTPL